jgi:hypothetical protein
MNKLPLALGLFALGLIAADNPATAPASAPASQPATLVVWDGETHNTGGGWVDHKDKETIQAQDAEAHSGKRAVAFTGKGGGWHGCGWNWTLWKADQATDASPYAYLTFWLKVAGPTPPVEMRVILTATNGKTTPQLNILKYTPDALDGQWHQVVVPLKDLFPADTAADPKKLWEIQLGNWNQAPCEFTAYLDDVAFTNAAPAAPAPATAK